MGLEFEFGGNSNPNLTFWVGVPDLRLEFWLRMPDGFACTGCDLGTLFAMLSPVVVRGDVCLAHQDVTSKRSSVVRGHVKGPVRSHGAI